MGIERQDIFGVRTAHAITSATKRFRCLRRVVTLPIIFVCLFGVLSVDPATAGVAGGGTVTIGEITYRIPGAYLRVATDHTSHGFLIDAELPDMLPAPQYAYHGWGQNIQALIKGASGTTSVSDRLDSSEMLYGPLTRLGHRYGLIRYRAAKENISPRDHPHGVDPIDTFLEIFIPKTSRDLFLQCDGDKAIPYPGCDMTFEEDGLIFHVTMSKEQLPHWRSVRSGVIKLVRGFKI